MTNYNIWLSSAASKMLARLRKGDMVTRNGGRGMVWLLKLAIIPLSVRTRVSDVRAILSFVGWCSRMARRSGVRYLIVYLKASQVLLQQSVGGQVLPDTRPLKAAVSRSRGGLPRVIPRLSRDRIRSHDRREIRLWMTLLGLYRVLDFPFAQKTLSFATIENPGKLLSGDTIVGFQRFLHDHFYQMASACWGSNPVYAQALVRNKKGKIPLWTDFDTGLKAEMFAVTRSSPTAGTQMDEGEISTSLASLRDSAARWLGLRGTRLWEQFGEWCKYTDSSWLISEIERRSEGLISNRCLGRLAIKEEAAGKIRVFAMVDAYTQWALYPLHRRLLGALSSIVQDGTFDQFAPVKVLLRRKSLKGLWSYDLSAATDRLPVQIQKIVLQPVLGIKGSEAWADILVLRKYTFQGLVLQYKVGQPMGAYSSWTMLALTHHALIQWAYYRVCIRHQKPYAWFNLYAVLGDDVILGDAEVAAEYLEVMATLGVEIGLAKSLVSPNRLVGEFAKRFFVPGDASMIPFKEVIAARFSLQETLEFIRKYDLSVPQVLSFSGFGYKVKGSLNKRFCELGSRSRNLLLMSLSPSGPWPESLLNWLHLDGWRRLGKRLGPDQFHLVVKWYWDHLMSRMKGRVARERKLVFQMMMVKRDHGNRFNPFDHLYDRYPMVVKKLDGYTYELAEIEKALKIKTDVCLGLEDLVDLLALERRLDRLPKPDSFDERSEVETRQVSLKAVRLWRQASNLRTNRVPGVK